MFVEVAPRIPNCADEAAGNTVALGRKHIDAERSALFEGRASVRLLLHGPFIEPLSYPLRSSSQNFFQQSRIERSWTYRVDIDPLTGDLSCYGFCESYHSRLGR